MRKIFTNPIAIAISLVHWLIVLFAMYGEHERSNLIGEFNQSLLVMFLIVINLPAILLATFFNNLLTFVGISTFDSNIGVFFTIIFVSLQWICIGYFIAFMLGEVKPTKFNLSLIDE
jgi:hypothetical protein